MWQKNNGQSESEMIRNRFTAYLSTAIRHRKREYILQSIKRQQIECVLDESVAVQTYGFGWEVWNELYVWMHLEDELLLYTLKGLTERERYVLLARILNERSFEDIAGMIGLSYKGAAAIYYRALQKVRSRMEVDDEF